MKRPNLPEDYITVYTERHETIRKRLREFEEVPPEEYLMELCYCILTPQSRARHAEQVIAELREGGFPEADLDPTPHLRDPAHYIRFHNQKARRLRLIADRRREITDVLTSTTLSSSEKREWLVEHIAGLGWKEASHLLRNIGHLDLAIIDRHILKHMVRCGAIDEIPRTIGTRRGYLHLEEKFRELARSAGLPIQELDLLFWSIEEGSVRK
jgi:N-glycosylase/DNA lyase